MWVHNDRTNKIFAEYISKPDFKVHRVNNTLSFNGSNPNDIRLNPDLERHGALGDVGWYSLRNILWAYNYELPISVVATMQVDKTTGAIMDIQGILNFSDQRNATFCNSMREAPNDWAEISTSDTVIRIPSAFSCREPVPTFTISGSKSETIQVQGTNQVVATINRFAQDCAKPTENQHWGEQTLKTMIIMDACYESAKAHGETIFLKTETTQNVLMIGQ